MAGKHNCGKPQGGLTVAPRTFPPAETVRGRVLGVLLRREPLSSLDCWWRFGSSRLSGHIHALRRLGWPVDTAERTVTTSDAGRPASVAFYCLPTNAITDAGEEGQRYAAECARVELERRAA